MLFCSLQLTVIHVAQLSIPSNCAAVSPLKGLDEGMGLTVGWPHSRAYSVTAEKRKDFQVKRVMIIYWRQERPGQCTAQPFRSG
jgi:hypothetical protein